MSTVRLLKDHPKYGKRGQTVTVPYLAARDLVNADPPQAERPGAARAHEGPATVSAAAYEAAGKRVVELEAANRYLADEAARLEAEGKKAADQLAKLAAENNQLTERVAALQKAAGK